MTKSPLKNTTTRNKSLNRLFEEIPIGSVVDSFLLYSGDTELALASSERFVCAHTNKYAIYEFWYSLSNDPVRMYNMVTSDKFKFREEMHEILQEKWIEYKDPVVRSSLFFMLNQMSESGLVSSGKLISKQFNPIALASLREYQTPETLHFIFDKQENFIDSINSDLGGDYILVSAGNFSYNLFEHGKSQSYDTTAVNHRKLKHLMKTLNKKMVLVYNYDKRVPTFYKKYRLQLIDKYGRVTQNHEAAQEIIVANF